MRMFFVVAIFKVKVTARTHIIKIWFFLLYYLDCWFLGIFGADYTTSKARLSYEKKCITVFRDKVIAKGQNLMFVRMISSKPSDILFSNLVLWFIIIMSQCHAKRLISYFQSQGHFKSSYDQNMTISTVSFEVLILLLPNLVWKYIIISQSVLWRNLIVVVKVTAKFQTVNECLCRWYSLNLWTFLVGVVMHHYEPDCLSWRLVCCLQDQGHS